MKKSVILGLIGTLVVLLFSCGNGEETLSDPAAGTLERSIDGYSQKGSFLNGSSLTIYELREATLGQTGRSFETQIGSNDGSFLVRNINLESPYILLKSNGYYYNEVRGDVSNAPIQLYVLADVENNSSVNVNVLTHLEYKRVHYLVAAGNSFEEAKKQAEKEVLGLFCIEKQEAVRSERMNIFKEGEENGALLAISAIVQGYRNEARLTNLLADISEDLEKDGKLENPEIGSELLSHAYILNLPQIRERMTEKYLSFGESYTVPDFEKYVTNFVEKCGYEKKEVEIVEFPEEGDHGKNILAYDKTEFKPTNPYGGREILYSLAARNPNKLDVKVVLTALKGNVIWYYMLNTSSWNITIFNDVKRTQTFSMTPTMLRSDVQLRFQGRGEVLVQYYINGADTPYKEKTITVK